MHFERLVLYIRFYICTIFTSKIDNFEISKLVGVLEADAKKMWTKLIYCNIDTDISMQNFIYSF